MSAVLQAAVPPKPVARLRFAGRVLNRVGVAIMAASLAGWAASALGWLPAMLEPFRLPMLALGSMAFVLAGAFPVLARLARARRMRWTRAAAAASLAAFVLAEAGVVAHAWTEEWAFLPILGGMVVLGIALLSDAREALRSRSLPRLGIAGAAAGGAGKLMLAGSVAAHGDWFFFAAIALLAFTGVAYFRVRPRLGDVPDGGVGF
jgi:hypothetical protein